MGIAKRSDGDGQIVSSGSMCRALFFFFQAEDGIRDLTVTGVQTCALPICGDLTDAELAEARQLRNSPGSQLATIVGDPIAARESVQRFADIGVDELILVMQIGRASCRERV